MSRPGKGIDRTLIVAFVAPLVIAGLFAVYRLATRVPAPPPPTVQEQLRDAAILFAETRLGRPLSDDERRLVRVEKDEFGNWRASFDEPLHSRIPPEPSASRPATAP
jgi:hypothetical protein